MDQQLARDAQPDVGSDQFACVKAVFRRLVPVGLHLAGHRCHCVVRQAGQRARAARHGNRRPEPHAFVRLRPVWREN